MCHGLNKLFRMECVDSTYVLMKQKHENYLILKGYIVINPYKYLCIHCIKQGPYNDANNIKIMYKLKHNEVVIN